MNLKPLKYKAAVPNAIAEN